MTKQKELEVKTEAAKYEDNGFETIQHTAGGKKFITFSKEEAGFSLIGTYKGISVGKFGDEITLIDKDGVENVFVVTAGLSDFRERVPVGATVKVIHNGLKLGKNGKEFRSYTILLKKE